ncbi:MAG: Cyclic pyranopterin monophosphate synthase [bacterium ADurb.Bin429]|nr:MAG: Cyclic pyranopterin monophosphate synthase [bacterium ADurb.Bin429]
MVTAEEMRQRLSTRYALLPVSPATESAAVATEYTIPGIRGRIGFISPLSEAFCARCSRLRLTADGCLKSCLFKPAELNLRPFLRGEATDEDLSALIRSAVAQKPYAHPPASALMAANDRVMCDIGG